MTDAHVHPKDLLELDPKAEESRRRLGIAAAASAWNREEFSFNRALAAGAASVPGVPPFLLCFAVHPQAAADAGFVPPQLQLQTTVIHDRGAGSGGRIIRDSLDALEEYAAAGKLAAIGECGFDLYNEKYRAVEAEQERLFAAHLDTALRYGLPLVLHVRRAMHKIFRYTKELKRLPAAVFHSWPGAACEGFSLLRRGISAYFSFGTTLLLGHKNAAASCAAFPEDRILFETDAPWQPLREKAFTSWNDLPAVVRAAAVIREAAGGRNAVELEHAADENFWRVFGG